MAIQWSDLRDEIRLAVLKDVPPVSAATGTGETFTDPQLLVAAKWACFALSMHTAQHAVQEYTSDGNSYQFALPDNIVDDIERAALVTYARNGRLDYLVPIRLLPDEHWPSATPTIDSASTKGYWQWENTLVLSFIPAQGEKIEVRYFKVWNPPDGDNSILDFPMQFERPFAYIVAAIAFDPLGAQASTIRQWNRKTDSGTPEDNSLQKQSRYFLEMADRALREIGPQDRETFYRKNPRDLGFKR